ncbi:MULTISPECIES: histone-like nucleoid-structuring protein, MvaT/MvaU family [Pseudomonas syringae group]|uniref:Transcriptional regulator n=1 Tax=Pseudomonas asturiensis TaxID=1190415 RepID=A0ABX6HE78_9PSED|nr:MULTISPECIES: histone-like nucleoid-structuring protein, MvaT/MvaU family [Pseudomonas syringae group]QHF03881.1 transcriptional regulator [Pseudomonas asturiensis]QXG39139.1 DNA binding protein [Pseudomonas viridiflava]
MSKLAEFRQLEQHLAEQLAALEALKGDAGLQQEIEFETKLRNLLAEYGKSLKDVVSIIDPKAASKSASKAAPAPQKSTRRARTVKVYKNPHNGEVVETKGGNHKTLKQWKGEYGSHVVESWVS